MAKLSTLLVARVRQDLLDEEVMPDVDGREEGCRPRSLWAMVVAGVCEYARIGWDVMGDEQPIGVMLAGKAVLDLSDWTSARRSHAQLLAALPTFEATEGDLTICAKAAVDALLQPSVKGEPSMLVWSRIVWPVGDAEEERRVRATLAPLLEAAAASRQLVHCELVTVRLRGPLAGPPVANATEQVSPSLRFSSVQASPEKADESLVSLASAHFGLRSLHITEIPMKTKSTERRAYKVPLLYPVGNHAATPAGAIGELGDPHGSGNELEVAWGSSVPDVDAALTRCVHRLSPLVPHAGPTQVLVKFVLGGSAVACMTSPPGGEPFVSHIIQSTGTPPQLILRCMYRHSVPAASAPQAAPAVRRGAPAWLAREFEALIRSAMLPAVPVPPTTAAPPTLSSAGVLRDLIASRREQLTRATAPLGDGGGSGGGVIALLLASSGIVHDALEQLQALLSSSTQRYTDTETAAKLIRTLQSKAAKQAIDAACAAALGSAPTDEPAAVVFWRELGGAAVRWATPVNQPRLAPYVEERCRRQVEVVLKTEPRPAGAPPQMPDELRAQSAALAGRLGVAPERVKEQLWAQVEELKAMTHREREDHFSGDRNNEHIAAEDRPRKRAHMRVRNLPKPTVDLGTSDSLLHMYWSERIERASKQPRFFGEILADQMAAVASEAE